MKFLLPLIAVISFSLRNAQPTQIKVYTHHNLEVVNAFTISLYPEMLRDSVSDPWMYRNTGLMRMAYAYFKPYYNQDATAQALRLIEKIGTGIYLLPLYYEDFPAVKTKTAPPEIIWSEVHESKDSALAQIDSFMQAAAQFYKAAHFKFFYKSTKLFTRKLWQK